MELYNTDIKFTPTELDEVLSLYKGEGALSDTLHDKLHAYFLPQMPSAVANSREESVEYVLDHLLEFVLYNIGEV